VDPVTVYASCPCAGDHLGEGRASGKRTRFAPHHEHAAADPANRFSAKKLADEWGEPPGNVSYHARDLRAQGLLLRARSRERFAARRSGTTEPDRAVREITQPPRESRDASAAIRRAKWEPDSDFGQEPPSWPARC
jgi:hypothetical protein